MFFAFAEQGVLKTVSFMLHARQVDMRLHLMVLLVLFLCAACGSSVEKSYAQPAPSHERLDALLKAYVNETGDVDYAGLQTDSANLNAYLKLLSKHHPNDDWTSNEQLAYWINAYNAFTLQLIIRNYPLGSIKDITFINIPLVHSPWDLDFIQIEGEEYNLNDIEHGIIRKQFGVPEIHFALVCAARSCPRLRREAYAAEHLEAQLADQARDFLSDVRKNRITAKRLSLSKLFLWYSGDFKAKGSLLSYVQQHTSMKIETGATIDYMDYDWSLNDQ